MASAAKNINYGSTQTEIKNRKLVQAKDNKFKQNQL